MPSRTDPAFRPTIATSRYRRYRLGPGIEGAAARGLVVALLAVFVTALALATTLATLGPSEQAQRLARLSPRQLLGESTEHFLPTPVTALAPQPNTGPPAVSAQEAANLETGAGALVEVVNTGGLGALLRAEPPSGRLVASLRDGQVLQVLERRTVGDAEWLRVRTAEDVEGWVFALLVAPAY